MEFFPEVADHVSTLWITGYLLLRQVAYVLVFCLFCIISLFERVTCLLCICGFIFTRFRLEMRHGEVWVLHRKPVYLF